MIKSYIDKVALIYIKDHQVLVTMIKGKDKWYIPGGKREANETDIECLQREIKEELSVDVNVGTLTHFGTYEARAHGQPEEGVMVRITCYMGDVSGELKPSSEIEKLDFFWFNQKHLTSPVDHLIFNDLQAKGYIT